MDAHYTWNFWIFLIEYTPKMFFKLKRKRGSLYTLVYMGYYDNFPDKKELYKSIGFGVVTAIVLGILSSIINLGSIINSIMTLMVLVSAIAVGVFRYRYRPS